MATPTMMLAEVAGSAAGTHSPHSFMTGLKAAEEGRARGLKMLSLCCHTGTHQMLTKPFYVRQ